MTPISLHRRYAVSMIGCAISALFVYWILSLLFVAATITIPVSIATSTLIFGLTRYYDTLQIEHSKTNIGNSIIKKSSPNDIPRRNNRNVNLEASTVSFVIIFSFLIIVAYFANNNDLHAFTSWDNIGALEMLELSVGILLCFFIPGYAIVAIVSNRYKIGKILAVLLAYLLSILITGLTAYISSLSFDLPISQHRNLFILAYLIILSSFIICFRQYVCPLQIPLRFKHYFCYRFISCKIIGIWKNLRTSSSQVLVFASLFTFIIISTYVVFGGITIGDQWYHQGRALLFMSGSFNEASMSRADNFYPPFQSALLAALTTLSGIPLVNSYASIAFLNAIPIFAFYYFFKIWVPKTFNKAALLACALFTLSAGFGWIYLFSTDLSQNIISQQSVLDTLVKMGRLDIVGTSNFVIPTGPDFSTGLIYIALPAGFVLLGLLRTNFSSRPISISLLVAVTTLGIITHYEFYIFVIIASILPIVFKMKQGNNVYFALLLSLSIVYLLDISTPGYYFSSLSIMGYPLLRLAIILLLITWTIYLVSNYLHKILESRLVLFDRGVKLFRGYRIFNFVTITAIIFLVTYVYLLSLMVMGELPLDTVDAQASEGNVPWYLYPMKMGVVGILGMAFILSYLYKKFEREIFVFGIIILVAIITGPYYSEYRFSKYVMIGMIGFASLMLYKILMYRYKIGAPRNIAIIGIIVVSSGLSMFMFIGFNSLILQTHDFIDTLPRRHFPSTSEMHLFELLYNKFNADPNKFNIVSFPNEYNRWKDGVMSKIPSFAGLPYEKLLQSPLTLNASTIDALYHHMASSDTRYIIIPKDSIKDQSILSEPIRFVLEYFKREYEDDDYILLEVPPLVSPNYYSGAQVALIYNQSNDLILDEVSDIRSFQFDNETFDFDDKKSITVQSDNMSQLLSLLGAKMNKGITIWSKEIPIEKKVNYIEASFRVVSEKENKTNDVRIEWHEANKRYYVKLSSAGLELYEILRDNQPKRILLKNAEMNKENWTNYTLKIQSLDDSIKIYLNNLLKIQVPKDHDNKNQTISKVGLTTNYNDVEFRPLKIGSLDDLYQETEQTIKYYNYYYPLSMLALSNSNYDAYSSSDSSVFTKKVILVSDSLLNDRLTFSRYMDYVLGGGKLIIVNSKNDFGTILSQLFALNVTAGEEHSFTNIARELDQNNSINVSGHVKAVGTVDLPNIKTIASYRNNKNEAIAPFIVEKSFPGGGKIYLLNSRAYFNTISNATAQHFPSLSSVTKLLPVDLGHAPISDNILTPKKGFVGKMQISGLTSINSTSLIFSDHNNYIKPYSIGASRLSIIKGSNNPIVFNNISIKDLKFTGDYRATIDINGTFDLPDPRSNHDYFGIKIPPGFNMTILPQSKGLDNIEIMAQNKSSIESIKVGNNSRLEFFGVKPNYPWKLVPLLVKEPEIKVDGQIIINDTYFRGFLNLRGGLDAGAPLDLRGQLETKLELVDNFDQLYRNTTKSKYVTYIQMIAMDGTSQEVKDQPKLPGDIHYRAKQRGQDIPLETILTSPNNIITVISLVALTILVGRIIWARKYS